MSRKLLIILIPFLVLSCQSTIQDKFISHFQDHKVKDSCYVKMTDFTNFDWDSLYVFIGYTSLEEINERLGFEYPYFIDIAQRLIFIKSNKVVYHEEYYPDPEIPMKLYFTFGPDTDRCKIFTRESDSFMIEKLDFVGSIFYQVRPIQLVDNKVFDKKERKNN
jgi:hypothetical protein